jgi:hypothetical protein
LVALAVVGVIAAAFYASLRIGFRARDSARRAVEPIQRADIAIDFLRRDIESALPPTGTLAGVFVGVAGQGDGGARSDDVLFCAAVSGPPAAMATDVRQVEYVVLTDHNQQVLLRRVTSNLLSPTTPLVPDDEPLCRGVRSFSVRYYDGSDWYDAWDSTQPASNIAPLQSQALPQAVQVTLELEPAASASGGGASAAQAPGGAAAVTVTRLIPLPCAVPASSTTGGLP